jgi:hypothetical protein
MSTEGRIVRIVGTALATGGAVLGTGAAPAVADPAVAPFQVSPVPASVFFDLVPTRCVTIVGEQPGSVLVAGADEGHWGCTSGTVRWTNLSTGATGTADMGDGLHGNPWSARLDTGVGQVNIDLTPPANMTRGFTSVFVP